MNNKTIEAKLFSNTSTLTDKITRYISLVHFLDFLQTKSLHMSSFTHFKDKFEGASFKNLKDGRIDGEEAKKSKTSMEVADRKKVLFSSCWTIGDETISMWDNYGKSSSDYIAIQFKVKDIIQELDKGNFWIEGKDGMRNNESENKGKFKPSSFFYGKIEYVKENEKTKYYIGRFKDKSFKHEKEFRFLVRRRYSTKGNGITELNGVKLKITNLKNMNFKIITSPYASESTVQSISSILKCQGYVKQQAKQSMFKKYLSI